MMGSIVVLVGQHGSSTTSNISNTVEGYGSTQAACVKA